MRLGLLEIIIIIIVIIALIIIARVSRAKKDTDRQNRESVTEMSLWQAEGKTNNIRRNLQRAGIAAIGTGIILTFTGVSLFRWALQSYIWSFIIVAMGFVCIFLSRKK